VHCLESFYRNARGIYLKKAWTRGKLLCLPGQKKASTELKNTNRLPERVVLKSRGSLFHEYAINEKGDITAANCIIPTNQNIANLEEDMKKIVARTSSR